MSHPTKVYEGMTAPDDRVVLIAKERGRYAFAVGRYRGSVHRPGKIVWYWEAWDVLGVDLGGSGKRVGRFVSTKKSAVDQCCEKLEEFAGLKQEETKQ